MAFWSGERLEQELSQGKLIEPFSKDRIDCASYPLTVGSEAFVTSDRFAEGAPDAPLVSVLSAPPNHTLRIPPGQFAFLLTHEKVSVPRDALALISIKTKYKFQGLINVSGFHVDPGFSGKLLFSVYNAGAQEVVIQSGQTMFMIVYADLDQYSHAHYYKGGANGRSGIDASLIQGMTSQVFSPLMLQRRMEDLRANVDLIKTVTIAVTSVVGILLAVAALFATFAPATLGVILAKTIEGAGYELKQKSSDGDEKKTAIEAQRAVPNAAVLSQPQATESGASRSK